MLKLLPRGASTGFGRAASRLFFLFSGSRRRILRENLTRAFPEKRGAEIRRIARACAGNLGAAFMEFLESSRLTREEILSRVTLAGEEHLDRKSVV